MVKILLSCDAVDFDLAITLKATFKENFNFKDVFLAVASWEGQENEHQRQAFEEEADLLVFEFGEASVSVWVMLEETDERNTDDKVINPRKKLLPETIDFDKDYYSGIRRFERILKGDFGLVNTRRQRPNKHVEQYHGRSPTPSPTISTLPQ